MKKLMIAMTLLAACSLTVQAKDLGGVNFDNRDVAEFDITDITPEGGLYWSRTTTDGDSEIVADTEKEGNKFLKIDESGVLSRAFESGAELIPENGGISVASKVQFTAQDAEDPAPVVDGGAKLAIWMKKAEATETDPVYTLMITAGKLDEQSILGRYDYEFKNADLAKALEENAWYNVEIKAEKNESGAIGFKIFFEGVELANPDGGLFLSLDQTTEAFDYIASLGFKGTGAADDLVFESYVNEQPIEVAANFDPAEAAEVVDVLTYTIDDGDPTEFENGTDGFTVMVSAIKEKITINVTFDGYEPFEKEYTKAEFEALGGELTITTKAIQQDTPTQIFITKIGEAAAGDTVTATGDIDFSDEITAMKTIDKNLTLDFAGYDVTGIGKTLEVVNDATLTIIATDATVANLRINVGRAGNNNGNLVITGGTWTIDDNTLVHVNGECDNSDVTITGATMTANGDNGVQFCGQGTYAITGSTITGATAVYCKAGTLTIGTSTLTGNGEANYSFYGNGAHATGDAIVIDNCDYPFGPADVTFGKGTVLVSKKKDQIGYYIYQESKTGTVEKAADVELAAPEGYIWKNDTTLVKITAVTPVVTIAQPIVEYIADMQFPDVIVEGDYELDTDYKVAWNSEAITEPTAGTTNTYTATVTMIGLYEGEGTATLQVYKKAEQPTPVIDPVVPGADIEIPAGAKVDEFVALVESKKDEILKAPEGATVDTTTYNSYFTAAVVGTQVEFVLNDTGKAAIQENADGEIVKIKPSEIAALTGESGKFEVATTIPGFYYAVKQGNGIGNMKVVEKGVLATNDKGVELTFKKYQGAGFYQIIVSEKPIPAAQ